MILADMRVTVQNNPAAIWAALNPYPSKRLLIANEAASFARLLDNLIALPLTDFTSF